VYASTRRSPDEQQHLLLTCQLCFDQAGLAPTRLKQEVSQTRHLIPLLQTFPSAIEAYSVFTHVTTFMLTEPLERLFTSKAPTTSLPRPPLRLLPGGTNQFPGGTNPAEKHRLSRRTCRTKA
jgi:hypothetical protein